MPYVYVSTQNLEFLFMGLAIGIALSVAGAWCYVAGTRDGRSHSAAPNEASGAERADLTESKWSW